MPIALLVWGLEFLQYILCRLLDIIESFDFSSSILHKFLNEAILCKLAMSPLYFEDNIPFISFMFPNESLFNIIFSGLGGECGRFKIILIFDNSFSPSIILLILLEIFWWCFSLLLGLSMH